MNGTQQAERAPGHAVPQFFASLGKRIQALQAAGHDVIRLDVGSPDLPPAPHILAALSAAAARPDAHGYQAHEGPAGLRAAWAEMYARQFGAALDPEREIVPLMGSKEGIFHLTMTLVKPGDVVLVPDPGYLTYTQAALFAGGEPYPMPLLAENGFLPDLAAIPAEVARRARLMWLNYPNNPTAATAPLEFLEEALNFARRHQILLCHDAAYTQVTFDGYRAPSLLEVPGARESAIEFSTLSKTYNMAGWRVAAALGSADALQTLYTLKTHIDSGHFLPVLEGAAAALTGDQAWLEERNEIYRRRRDLLFQGLQALGLRADRPRASLYLWVQIPAGWTSAGFAAMLLEEARVSLTPGTVFGPRGEGYLRISVTAPEARLEQALARLAAVQDKSFPPTAAV